MYTEIIMAIMAAIVVDVVRIEHRKWIKTRVDRKHERMKKVAFEEAKEGKNRYRISQNNE